VFPPGSGNVAAPVVPPVVKPVAKAWVFAPNDNVGYAPTGTGFNPPLTLPAPPVKGCVILSIENLSSGDGQPYLYVYVYDGTTWQNITPSTWSMAASHQPPTFRWWCADRSYVEGPTFDPSDTSAEAFAWAEADGIHVLWNGIAAATTPAEKTFPYPAGVTLADMPASKTF
jgi:hypothetical protein